MVFVKLFAMFLSGKRISAVRRTSMRTTQLSRRAALPIKGKGLSFEDDTVRVNRARTNMAGRIETVASRCTARTTPIGMTNLIKGRHITGERD